MSTGFFASYKSRTNLDNITDHDPEFKSAYIKKKMEPKDKFKQRADEGALNLKITPELMFEDYESQDEEEIKQAEIQKKIDEIKLLLQLKINTLHG